MKTDSMTKFDYLYLGGLIVEVFLMIAGWDYFLADFAYQLHVQGGDPRYQQMMLDAAPWIYGFSLAIGLLCWVAISVWKFGFFRYVLALFVAVGFVSLVAESMQPNIDLFLFSLTWLSMILTVASLFFVFRADAGAWLRGEA